MRKHKKINAAFSAVLKQTTKARKRKNTIVRTIQLILIAVLATIMFQIIGKQ